MSVIIPQIHKVHIIDENDNSRVVLVSRDFVDARYWCNRERRNPHNQCVAFEVNGVIVDCR